MSDETVTEMTEEDKIAIENLIKSGGVDAFMAMQIGMIDFLTMTAQAGIKPDVIFGMMMDGIARAIAWTKLQAEIGLESGVGDVLSTKLSEGFDTKILGYMAEMREPMEKTFEYLKKTFDTMKAEQERQMEVRAKGENVVAFPKITHPGSDKLN